MVLLLFIVGLATLILVHEIGHFAAARLMGIEVEEFGIGFPPRITKLFTYGGTDYTLNWIPLGGFVRPKGENDPEIQGGLAAANPWARLFVLFAGPVMNLLVGFVIYTYILFRIGQPIQDQVIVLGVSAGSPAEQAGLMVDDVIVQVNDTLVDSQEVLKDSIQANLDQPIHILVDRSGQALEIDAIPSSERTPEEGSLGILMSNPTMPIPLTQAAVEGADALYRNMIAILALPAKMISGDAAPQEGRIVGYKGMVDILGVMAERDQQAPEPLIGINTLYFFGAITVSLGLLNLFPLPALDGGRIIFVLPELIFNKRVPAQYENTIHLIGFAFWMVVLVYVNIQDFINPVLMP